MREKKKKKAIQDAVTLLTQSSKCAQLIVFTYSPAAD